MHGLLAIALGGLIAIGIVTVFIGLKRVPVRINPRLRQFRAKNMVMRDSKQARQALISVGLAVGLAFGAWSATGWPVAILIGAATGFVVPKMVAAPNQRRAVADEIEAYSQWTEQIRDLVSASGSLFEAVTLSSPSSPPLLRPQVEQMASLARTIGLMPAMSWFANRMASPYADRLVLGMSISWESGARVTEAFESTARSMRTEVEMRRRNEVANARVWTQVTSILGITVVSVVLMFVFNRGFFGPFGSTTGQIILLVVGVLIFGNVLWVLQLSGSGVPIRLLGAGGLSGESDVTASMKDTASMMEMPES